MRNDIGEFAATLDQLRPYPTREFLYRLGKDLARGAREDGIVTAACSGTGKLENIAAVR
jgi:hypothetical protein